MLNANTLATTNTSTEVMNIPAMMANSPQANDKQGHDNTRLDVWLSKLPKAPLFVHRDIAHKMVLLLNDENCDSDKLAQRIKQDPLLCLMLFDCTQQAFAGREGDIQHLAHLTSLIGMNKVEHVITQATKKATIPEGFSEILAASMFAAHLSNTLLINRHHGHDDRFYIPTLLFNAPLWLMWIAAPKAMSQGQRLASRKQQSYPLLCRKKLGFELDDLLNHAQDLATLPTITQHALRISPAKDLRFWATLLRNNDEDINAWFTQDKRAKHYFYSIEMGIYLLNHYVIALYLDWGGKHIQRYSQLLCRHLGIELSTLRSQTMQSALGMRLPHHLKGLYSPISRIKGLHKEETPTEPKTEPNVDTPKPAKTPSLNAWLNKMRDSKSVNTAYHTTLQALSQCVGVEHCIIMNVDAQSIHTHACYGFDDSNHIHSFYYEHDHQPHLFHQLIQKPACISIAKHRVNNAARSIPDDFTALVDLQACAFISIFSRNNAKAIIYCDHAIWDEKKHHSFKLIGKSLSKVLEKFS